MYGLPSQTGPSSLRILIVEDEADIVDMLREVLTVEGHTVVTAAEGTDGLACFTAEPFDIVLTDLNMPGISGLEMAERIKKLNSSIPVILLTGWDVGLDHDELMAKGIDCFMKKPFAITAILQSINNLCGGRKK
jgi:CheY-like chemotaxis protein